MDKIHSFFRGYSELVPTATNTFFQTDPYQKIIACKSALISWVENPKKKTKISRSRITEVVECLESLQSTCYFYHEFFPYRHLVTSLRKSVDWACQDLRGRFRSKLIISNINPKNEEFRKDLKPKNRKLKKLTKKQKTFRIKVKMYRNLL